MTDTLATNQQLSANEQLTSTNGKVLAVLQGDGNFVVYWNSPRKALWASHTAGTPVDRAVMQGDGNFVLYDSAGKAYWATGTNPSNSRIVMQNDGNLVVYDDHGKPEWASNTVVDLGLTGADSGDVHVRTGSWMHSWADMASTGLISGRTRTWSTIKLKGFHGSVFPVVLDVEGKAIWPRNPNDQKHQYGVDGVWSGTHDRTDAWANQVDPDVVGQAHGIGFVHYYDPVNQTLKDIPIIAKTVAEIVAAIAVIVG